MPRSLRWALYIALFQWHAFVFLVVIPFIIAQAVAHGEPSFSGVDRVWLTRNYPGGVYTSDHGYKWCDGRTWQHYDVVHDGQGRGVEGVFNNYTILGEQTCASRPRESMP